MVEEQTKKLPNNQANIVRNMANTMKANPQQMLNQIINSNPQAKTMMNMLRASGQSPKQLFFTMAREKGIDPNSIIEMIR